MLFSIGAIGEAHTDLICTDRAYLGIWGWVLGVGVGVSAASADS